jgi:type VI protein secretion system component Hcp
MENLQTSLVAMIENIRGESAFYKDGMDIYDVSWGVQSNSSAAIGGGMGVAGSMWDRLRFSTRIDTAFTRLQLACAKSEHLAKLSILCFKGGGQPELYCKAEFSDVVLTSVTTHGTAGELLVVRVEADYSRINIVYSPQGNKGNLTGQFAMAFDIKTQK